MKKINIFVNAVLLSVLVACNNNESPKVTIHELGIDNSKTVVAGTDLHIDAEIMAENKVASIQLVIHSELEHVAALKTNPKMNAAPLSWELDSIYTKGYMGVKNTDFHEHIDVPIYATPGDYHLHLKVTDMDGNQTVKEAKIEVLSTLK